MCGECGLGLLLQCAEDVAPKPGDPFLVLDHTLSVCAVSAAAERLLATPEIEAVNVPIGDLLVAADAESNGGAGLAAAVIWAARGDGGVHADGRPPRQHVRRSPDRPHRRLRSAARGAARVRVARWATTVAGPTIA